MKLKVLTGLRPRPDSSSRWREVKGLVEDARFVVALLRRRWIFVALSLLLCGSAALWVGLKTPTLYQSETALEAKEEPSALYPYSTSGARNLGNRDLNKIHLVATLRGETVIRRSLAEFEPAEIAALVGRDGPVGEREAVDRIRRDLVKVRLLKDSPVILLYLRAGDSALTARFSRAFLRSCDETVRAAFRETSRARVRALESALARNTDPALDQGIREALAAETERSLLMGGPAVRILSGPNVSEKRVAPQRKLVLALALSLGFTLALAILLFADRRARERFIAVRRREDPLEEFLSAPPSLWRDIAAVPLIFLVMHSLSFKVAPSLTTARAVLGLLLLWILSRGGRPLAAMLRAHFASFLILALVLAHAVVGYALGSGESLQVSRLVELFYLGLLGPVFVLALAGRDWYRFHLRVMLAILAQSVMHLVSFVSSGFREFVAAHLTQLGNYELTYAIVPPGFSNGAAASFSVVQALGLISTLVTLRNARSVWMAGFCAIAATLTLVSGGVAGRTGMLISLLMMGVFAQRSGAGLRIAVLSALSAVVALFVVFLAEIKLLLSLLGEDLDWQLNSILKRSFEIFKLKGKTNSLQELAGMYIPPLNYETVFGTGVVRSIFGARHDSGYVQAYFALGLPLAALFYGAIFLLVLRLRASLPERPGREIWLFSWLIAIMFLLDVKEPFITHSITFYTVAAMLAYASPRRAGATGGRVA